MAKQTRTKTTSQTGTATLEFEDFDLNSTMQDFLKDEEKETGKSIWNVATISGMVMIFLALTFAIQTIGVPVGGFLADLAGGLIGSSALPLIGGALITLVGFGFLVGDRKRARKIRKAQKQARRRMRTKSANDGSYTDIPGSQEAPSYTSRLKNALDSESGSSSSSDLDYDSYGYRHSRKLMKSRTDKKISGVCGGLAKYFGISTTVVRVIFVAAFFMGYGASFLIYLGLSLAMPKEPIELMDDFDF